MSLDMNVCVDDHALICTDCIMLHTNGDLSSFSHWYGAEAEERETEFCARVASHLVGKYVSPGWGREQHDCTTNYTVTTTRADGTTETKDVLSEETYLDDVLTDVDGLLALEIGDSLTITRRELQTVSEQGGECDCETFTFRSDYCDSCGIYMAGEFHAATIWGSAT